MKQLHNLSKTTIFLLLCIFLLSLFLRLYRYEKRLFYFGDTGEELINAELMWRFNQVPLLGQYASATEPGLFVPPYYLILQGILLGLANGDTLMVMRFWKVVMVFVPVAIYFLGAAMYGSSVGLVAALLCAVFSVFVRSAWMASGNSFLLPFLIGMVFVSAYAKDPSKLRESFVYVGLLFVLLSGSIYFAPLFLVPLLFVWVYAVSKNIILMVKLLLFVVVVSIVVYYPTISYMRESHYFEKFRVQQNTVINLKTAGRFASVGSYVFNNPLGLSKVSGAGAWSMLVVLAIMLPRKKVRLKKILPYLSFVFWYWLLLSLRERETTVPYVILIYPFLFVIISYMFVVLFREKSDVSQRVIIVGAFCLFVYFVANGFSYLHDTDTRYTKERSVVKAIVREATLETGRELGPGDVSMMMYTPYSSRDWESRALWYFLQAESRVQLYKHSPYTSQEIAQGKTCYVVCADYYGSLYTEKDCLDKFNKYHPGFYVISTWQSPDKFVRVYKYKHTQ